jgi:predicted DNA-binding protein (MmcQ/YjbR family)
MAKTITDAVRELCLAFPDSEEVISHGSPNFKSGGKTFATCTINHHGDGRVALNIASPPGTQQLHTEMEPDQYFVPPYVGPKGWVGIDLNSGLSWKSIANHVRAAWENVVPVTLSKSLTDTPSIKPPTVPMTPQDIDPFLRPRAIEVMGELRALCEKLPETKEGLQFGNRTFKAGKKTVVSSHCYQGRFCLHFWVGADQQSMLTYDQRYKIPAYMGHNGWIELDVHEHADWAEIESLLHASYRHFTLQRMLKALDDDL